jgi:hypothetical protein
MRSTNDWGLDIEHLFDLASGKTEQAFTAPVPGDRSSRSAPERSREMAMVRVEPVEVRVRADWFDGRPREVTLNGRRLRVLDVIGVRDESSAFPVVTGPRTLFEIETAEARLQLSFRHRTRRWTIEGVETRQAA